MFFFGLAIFLICGWFFPWWSLMVLACLTGWLVPAKRWSGLQVTFAAAVAWAALSYMFDGRSYGIISLRMSGLFGLRYPALMYLVMAVLGFVTAGLGYKSGLFINNIYSSRRVTSRPASGPLTLKRISRDA